MTVPATVGAAAGLVIGEAGLQAAFSAFESLASAVAVVSRTHQIVLTNPAADALLSCPSMPLKMNGCIQAHGAVNAVSLATAIAHCALAGFGEGISRSIRLSGSPGEGVVARIASIPDSPGANHGAAVMMFLSRERMCPIDLAAMLSTVYKLSPGEVELVKLLADGLTPEDIARKREVAMATVKSQLRSVFAKTGSSRQSDLMRLAFSIAH